MPVLQTCWRLWTLEYNLECSICNIMCSSFLLYSLSIHALARPEKKLSTQATYCLKIKFNICVGKTQLLSKSIVLQTLLVYIYLFADKKCLNEFCSKKRWVFASVLNGKIFVRLWLLLLFQGKNKVPSYFVGFAQQMLVNYFQISSEMEEFFV